MTATSNGHVTPGRQAKMTCSRCEEEQLISQSMAALLKRLPSGAPYVCSKCAVDGKGALGPRPGTKSEKGDR